MKMTKKQYIIIFLFILLVSSVIASSRIGRFQPTHMIVKQVFCISCHPDEMNDLERGRHINIMNTTQSRFLTDYIDIYGNVSEDVKTLLGSCYSCHVTYQRYELFGLTDPYAFNDPDNGINSQYGYLIHWPINNLSIPGWIFDEDNDTSIHIELDVLDISPINFTVDTTIKIVLANYSGQQTGSTVFDSNVILGKEDTIVMDVVNISEDYFKIILILDGLWNTTLVNLRVNNTDRGMESFFIIANSHPFVYELPLNMTGVYYFKTNGTYKAIRLDYVWSEWRNYSMRNITTSEVIQTNNTDGWINASTCSAPDGMCHINQKATYIGMNDGTNPDRSFYFHRSRYVTSLECKLCHLNRMKL